MEQQSLRSSWFSFRLDRRSLRQTLRTTVAAIVSLLAGHACRLPEAHWAVMTTIIVMQSSLGAAWDISRQRLIGTLLGGITAAALGTYFAPGLLTFAAGMLVTGLVCAFLPRQTSVYRFAGITLAIIMLPRQIEPIFIVALHRFLEVSVGIVVGMAIMTMWPDRASTITR